MLKALVVSSYPAPYRVSVFRELSKAYNLHIYFDANANEDRNPDWFCVSNDFSFQVLDNKESKASFWANLRKIRQYDFVIAYDPLRLPSMMAIALSKAYGIPYFTNVDGAIASRHIIKDMVKKWIFSGICAGFSSGKSATDYYLHYGVDRDRIWEHKFSSLQEADILQAEISPEEKLQYKQQCGMEKNPVVLAVGQFIYRKGFDILIRAMQSVNKDVQLYLIGGGREDYRHLAEMVGSQRIHILNFMNKEELSIYYKAADVFVLPTREDIWGLVINEAMAYGLPVITTDKCNAGLELIENGVNGFIVPVENTEALAQAINTMLMNDEARGKMSRANLEKIKGATIEAIAQRHIDAITESLAKNQ